MKRVYKGFPKITATTMVEIQSACLGCDNCTGACRCFSDLITIPELVLQTGARDK